MYKAINGWTKAKMIEKIYKGNNGKRCTNSVNGICAYRGRGGDNFGNSCAVGVFIPDDLYTENMEGLSAIGLINNYPVLVDYVPLPKDGLDDLQSVHDKNNGIEDVREELKTWINTNVED